MNDLEVALAAVRVLHDQARPDLDARVVALRVLNDFVRYHTPAVAQFGIGAIGQRPARQGLANAGKLNSNRSAGLSA